MISKLLNFLLKLCFVCHPFAFTAQTGGVITYAQEQGLFASSAYRISQDRDGFIWIGSDNGLFRFDGVEFKQFNQKDGLRNLDVLFPIPMADGSVFIAPFQNDFAVYKNGKIINDKQNRELAKLNGDHPIKLKPIISPDKSEICFIADYNPETIYLYKNGKVRIYPLKLNYSSANISFCSVVDYDFNGNIYFNINERSLFKYNIFQKKFVKLNDAGFKSINFIKFNDEKYLTYLNNVLCMNNIRRSLIMVSFPKEIFWVLPSDERYIWVSFTNGGLVCFDLKKDPQLKFPVYFLNDQIINDAFIDKDENVWFSNKNGSVLFMNKAYFKSYMNSPIKKNNSYITAISGNSQSVIIGYNNGECILFKDHRISTYLIPEQNKLGFRTCLINERFALLIDKENLYQIDLRDKQLRKQKIRAAIIKSIFPFTKNRFLLCTNKEVVIYDPFRYTFTPVLTQKSYTSLFVSENEFFIGSFRDLYKYNVRSKEKKLFLKGYYFTDLKKIKKNLYLGSTNGSGLILFNDKGIVKKITTEDGLSSNQIKRIEIENEKTYWVITNVGLSKIYSDDRETGVSNFTKEDGLPSERVSGCAIRKDSIYVGTVDGLAILSIKDLCRQESVISKKVIINSVLIGNRKITEFAHPFSTPYASNNIVINLSFLNYVSQGKISYRYKIENLSKDWQTSTSSRINLTAIPPGNYVFKVYGIGHNGKQSKEATILRFEIKPEFWQTLWFRALIFLVLAVIIFSIGNYLFHKKRNKKLVALEFEKKIAELELQAIKAQMNPHFVYNCLNSIQYLLYKKDYHETQSYLDVFTKVIRKTLHYSEKTFTTIGEEVEYLKLYLEMEKLRFSDNFSYTVSITNQVNPNWKIPSLLIQPFAENSLKHGFVRLDEFNGFIEIQFDYSEPELRITIRDNGVGFGKQNLIGKEDSFGIRLSKKRIDTFKKLFKIPIRLEAGNHAEGGAEIKLYLLINDKQD